MRRKKNSSKAVSKPSSFGDSLRERVSLRSKKEQDIRELWEEQKRQKTEAILLEREIKKTKKQTRELKKKKQQNYFDIRWSAVKSQSSKYKKHLIRLKKRKGYKESITFFKKYNKTISYKSTKILKNKKITLPALGLASLVTVLLIFNGNSSTPNDTLGDSTSVSSTGFTSQSIDNSDQVSSLPKETPAFSLLYPNSKGFSDFEVVKISPATSAPAYTFADSLVEAKLNVTEQELPANFIGNIDTELDKLASSFQATDIIQIDEMKVYHGFTERSGGVQSLIFIKNELLIFIKSDKKLSDDIWVGYITSLK